MGLAKVWPRAPEIGQRSQSTPPRTGAVAEYFDAVTGKGTSRLVRPSGSTVTVPSPVASSGSRPTAGRPSTGAANGEGVSADSGTR